jgi:hypothetical protein
MSEPLPPPVTRGGIMRHLRRGMVRLPFVTWDRWAGDRDHAAAFGWIPREDGRFDFVRIESDGEGYGQSTSSAEYSARISEMLNGRRSKHHGCRRIEDDFPGLENVVRLPKEPAA